MGDGRIRVATIGTWGHIVHVLAELAPLGNVQFVAHARSMPDDDPAVIHRMTHQPAVRWYEDYHTMLREVKPQVVIVSTRLDRINPVAIDAAEAGCHLICEKPLALSHGDLEKLYAICTAKKLQCITMLGNGRHPVMQAALKIISAGEIGEVVLLNARKSYKWGSRPEWFGDRRIYGTTLSWVAVHALEMIHLLSGQNFASVAAMQSNRVHTERKDCQDNGLIQLSLSNGAHASVSFDYLRPTAAATHGDDGVRVVGSWGIIEANLDQNWCRYATNQNPVQEVMLPARQPYYAEFLQTVSESEPTEETRRAFHLASTCLHGNDAADRQTVEPIPRMPWDL